MFTFKIIQKDEASKARAGEIQTPHGTVHTPAFVPVGTQGTVKGLTPSDLKEIGAEILFGNTYHLHLRPGEDRVKEFGGLGKFMGWDKVTITDSGGFQVFSLGRKLMTVEGEEVQLVKISDEEVRFRSHLDGSLRIFTPEKSIAIQQKLGADIMLPLDHCPPHPSTYEETKKAVARTHAWAMRCLKELKRHSGKPKAHPESKDPGQARMTDNSFQQALYGIVQGGVYKDLRQESAKFIAKQDFDGIAIGGVAVGESKKEMQKAVDWTVPFLPEDKPRHLLGVGEVDDIFEIIERGIDTFDCVLPTRFGRYGIVFVSPPAGNLKSRFRLDLAKAELSKDKKPIDKNCNCSVCQNFTRGYLHHLFRAKELLAYRLASYHNMYFIVNLTKNIRQSIIDGSFSQMKKEWLKIV